MHQMIEIGDAQCNEKEQESVSKDQNVALSIIEKEL